MKTILSALLLLGLAGCGGDVIEVSGYGGGGTGNPNRLPPGRYVQGPLSIPSALDDPLYFAQAPWSPSFLWSFQESDVFSQFSGLSLPERELVVAVIDTGVDRDHEDLVGRLWVNGPEAADGFFDNGIDDDGNGYVDDLIGWDFANGTNNPSDDHGHGTHVAGTIGAIANNGRGIVGVAPWVRIMSLKVCGSTGTCDPSDIRAAMAYAVRHGARIINLSLGGPSQPSESTAFELAVAEATRAGALVVAAAGNALTDAAEITPANATYAVAVAAHRSDGSICSFSDYGWKVDLSGPGCALNGDYEVSGVLSLNSRKCGPTGSQYCASRNTVGEAYALKQGTSMAAPHAAGMAAVAWTASPEATPLQIRQALLRTARAVQAGRKHVDFGMGTLSGVNLIDEARNAPGIKITTPLYGAAVGSGTTMIGFRVEARTSPVQWRLKQLAGPGGDTIDLAGGTAFADGEVGAGSSVELAHPWTRPGSGEYVLLLEATSGGRKYYDLTLVR